MKMFEELIKVNRENNTVSARELHEFLGVNTQFTIWFNRMCEYGFEENSDFRAITQKRLTAQGNTTTYIDYEITLDMAKEISMIQRSEKGKQARQYFIQCEKFIQDSKLTEEFKYYRKTGKIARKDLTDTIKEKLQPSNQFVYGNYTELGYLKVFGKKTKELKQERNLKPKDNLRNHFTPEELKEVLKVEEEIKSLIIAFNLMNIDKKEVYKKIKEIMLKNQ
ncbi:MAG: antA/AntB antirepressor family protein [Tenericutes bacterium]|nr:antA/AntB antirepressor family protein [Mycoplasmatota bacterium]